MLAVEGINNKCYCCGVRQTVREMSSEFYIHLYNQNDADDQHGTDIIEQMSVTFGFKDIL